MHPFPGNNSVIIMDNTKIHHDSELVILIEGLDCHIIFLPQILTQSKLRSQPLNHGLDITVIL